MTALNMPLLLSAAAFAFWIPTSAAASTYSLTILKGLSNQDVKVSAINDAGELVGFAYTDDGGQRAVYWSHSQADPQDLGAYGGRSSWAVGINEVGQIVGAATEVPGSISPTTPLVWTNGVAAEVPPPGERFPHTRVSAINKFGTLVGSASSADGVGIGVIWRGGAPRPLAGLFGLRGDSSPGNINDRGQAVGYSTPGGSVDAHATLWENGEVVDLTPPGWADMGAIAINNQGDIIGYGLYMPDAAYYPVRWIDRVPHTLGTLDRLLGAPSAINDVGAIVGTTCPTEVDCRATLWRGAAVIDLNWMLDEQEVARGWVLRYAYDINNHGVIVGHAFNKLTRKNGAYVLSPTP